jgi:hypothetical protein
VAGTPGGLERGYQLMLFLSHPNLSLIVDKVSERTFGVTAYRGSLFCEAFASADNTMPWGVGVENLTFYS